MRDLVWGTVEQLIILVVAGGAALCFRAAASLWTTGSYIVVLPTWGARLVSVLLLIAGSLFAWEAWKLEKDTVLAKLLGRLPGIKTLRFWKTFRFWPGGAEPRSLHNLCQRKVDQKLRELAEQVDRACTSEDEFNRAELSLTASVWRQRWRKQKLRRAVSYVKWAFWSAQELAEDFLAEDFEVHSSFKAYLG